MASISILRTTPADLGKLIAIHARKLLRGEDSKTLHWSKRTIVAKLNDPTGILGDSLIISVKEARKLLGQKANNMTNEELKSFIEDAETVVRLSVRKYIGSKNVDNGDSIKPIKTGNV
ncbi:MAG: hypothetical protein QG549_175 [Patescibacteria group bacterium]|nr:hypothetical protein [Patescibacteria group bacterium]